MYLLTKKTGTALSFFFCALVSGCALVGGGTDIERASGYHFSAPSGWKTRRSAESDRAFRLRSGNLVTVVSSCHRNPDAPLDVLTRHLLMGTRGVKIQSREKVRLGNNEGLLSKVETELQSKRFYLELFVLAKNECVFDFSLISPDPIPETDFQEFREFIASFDYGNRKN